MKRFFSLVAFSHTVFAFPFALVGYFIAIWDEGHAFSWTSLLLVALCMVLARTAAMAFNRFADAAIDAANPRTQQREIPSGKVSRRAALGLAVFCAAAFWAATYFLNRLCFLLAPVALLIILGYSFTKRFTSWSHLVLGLGLALAPVGAYLAVTGQFGVLPIMLGAAVLFWVAGFDVIYALQDRNFDLRSGLHSIPARFGIASSLRISEGFHLISVLLLLATGWYGDFGIWYWLGWLTFSLLLIHQHRLVSEHDLSRVNAAFFTTNGMASVIFCVFVLVDFL